MTSFQDSFWGPHGFDELRKSVKEGQDFSKDLAAILHERSDLEASYAKSLSKLSTKVSKALKMTLGTTQHAWQQIAVEMENEAELHKNVGNSLAEDVVKPMKLLLENQHKHRKFLEATVDKATKILNDKRNEELKAKKLSYSCARENERMQDQALDSKFNRGKLLTEKDINKFENKRRKAEETLTRADVDYYNSCIKAERARQDRESAIYRASTAFQQLEEERLSNMHDLVQKYANHLSVLGPKLVQGCERLNLAICSVDVVSDLQTVVEKKGTGPNVPEQILPDFYAENMNNEMNRDRRKETLERFLTILKHDLELERKGKQGVENLAKVFQETPTFGDAEAQHDVFEKLQNMRAMLTYLEASRYKLQCAMAEVEGFVKPTHPLVSHMEVKNKQILYRFLKMKVIGYGSKKDFIHKGTYHTVLKVPHWVRMERRNSESSGSAASDIPDNDMPQDQVDSTNQLYANLPAHSNCLQPRHQCQAIYSYEAKLSDELSLNPGDIIAILERTQDGWWRGELNGVVGVFPSTYVQDILLK